MSIGVGGGEGCMLNVVGVNILSISALKSSNHNYYSMLQFIFILTRR